MSSENVSIEEGAPEDLGMEPLAPSHPDDPSKPAPFDFITENIYLTERGTSKEGKRTKRMVCDCQFDPEADDPSEACGENCLNRLLMIECGSRCPCGEYCNNRRFQRAQYAPVRVCRTEKKGWGLIATEDIAPFSFVLEYCGEVCTPEEFQLRKLDYGREKRRHYYFMSLTTEEILDATRKGNLSRFINHSCDPNCETQKWTVGGKLRVGFFSLRAIANGDELTFDYQFQRFGEAAQNCYCESANCRGFLGAAKQSDPRSLLGDVDVPSPEVGHRRKGRGKRGHADIQFEKDLYGIVGAGWRLRDSGQVLVFSRLMLQAESLRQRQLLLRVLQSTEDSTCLKKFFSLHGLRLLWSWMVELADESNEDVLDTRLEMLQTLQHLPIPNKNVLTDNKILAMVSKWAEPKEELAQYLTSDKDVEHEEDNSPAVTVSEADCSQRLVEEDQEKMEEGLRVTVSEADCTMQSEREGEGADVLADLSPEDGKAPDSGERDEESSCEAEAREVDKDAIESLQSLKKQLAAMASELLEHWAKLKEVFRIPKKVSKKPFSPAPVDSPSMDEKMEGVEDGIASKGQATREEQAEETVVSSKRDYRTEPSEERKTKKPRRESRWDSDKEWTKNDARPGPVPAAAIAAEQRSSLLGSAPTGLPPLQSTLIVQQQPGQSVYVQQQVFPLAAPITNSTQYGTKMVQTQFLPPVSAPVSSQPFIVPQHQQPTQPTSLPILPGMQVPASLSSNTLTSLPSSLPHSLPPLQTSYTRPQNTPLQLPPLQATPLKPTPMHTASLQPTSLHPVHLQPTPLPAGALQPPPLQATSLQPTPLQAASLQPTPVQVTPVQPHPLKATPLQTSSLQTVPLQPAPLQATPLQPTRMQGVPIQPIPLQAISHHPTTLQATPQHPTHLQATPQRLTPLQVRPQRLTPLQATPQHPAPFQATPQHPAPLQAPPQHLTPLQATPQHPNPLQATPQHPNALQAIPLHPTPLQATPLQVTTLLTTSIQPTPLQTTLLQATPLQLNPFQMTPSQTTSLQSTSLQQAPMSQLPATFTLPSLFASSLPHTGTPLQGITVPHLQAAPLPPPPPDGDDVTLPFDWRSARDSNGKVYYYHVVTRKTQWERPTEEDKDGEILMDLGTPDSCHSGGNQGQPHTPDESPPLSNSPYSSPSQPSSPETTPPTSKRKNASVKDTFRHSLSKVVVRCLDHHRKPECKYGRITCGEDFKYLARKLTHGLTEKEISRKGGTDGLAFNSSVKSRTKDYIRNYMKKFGPLFSRQ